MTEPIKPEPVEPELVEPEPVKPEPVEPEVGAVEVEPSPEPGAVADEPVVHPPRHRRRFGRGPVLAALLLAALGFSLVVQVRQTSVVGIASLNQSELVQILGTVTGQSQKVEQETQELLRTQAELRSGSDRAAAAEKAARERIQVLGILAGTVPARGEGIELSITDGENPVNSSAVLNAVQELRDAGAEAMQISSSGGSVRIVASTAFTDELSGSATGILVSRQLMRSPYTITAIGDRETMSSALKIPGGVIDALRQSGALGEVRDVDVATVSAVVGEARAGYASPAAG